MEARKEETTDARADGSSDGRTDGWMDIFFSYADVQAQQNLLSTSRKGHFIV